MFPTIPSLLILGVIMAVFATLTIREGHLRKIGK